MRLMGEVRQAIASGRLEDLRERMEGLFGPVETEPGRG